MSAISERRAQTRAALEARSKLPDPRYRDDDGGVDPKLIVVSPQRRAELKALSGAPANRTKKARSQ